MTATGPSAATPPAATPHATFDFAARQQVDVLCAQLRRAFADKQRTEPLVIGLFGEWGTGKTLCLQHIGDQFPRPTTTPPTHTPVTLAITFNAWRYENEPHLIVPLLKTTERELNVPMIGKVSLDLSKIWQTDHALQNRNHTPSLSAQTFPELASIYFDFRTTLSQIVGVNSQPPLNLLFLIDDLDCCLPEKAVQLLESIKLFLDVPGCGFVLALDEEVIERSIAHRYRDYGTKSTPITGHEYLEKTDDQPVWNQPLLDLFRDVIPPVPRKLHRTAELLQTKLAIAKQHGWTNPDRLTLARLTYLELFAPDVYRFARRHALTRLLPILHAWADICQHTPDIRHPGITQWLQDRTQQAEKDDGIRYDLERQLKPLYEQLCAAAEQRSGVEPLRLADPQHSSDHPNIRDYFDLKPSPKKTVPEHKYSPTAPQNDFTACCSPPTLHYNTTRSSTKQITCATRCWTPPAPLPCYSMQPHNLI